MFGRRKNGKEKIWTGELIGKKDWFNPLPPGVCGFKGECHPRSIQLWRFRKGEKKPKRGKNVDQHSFEK